MRGVVRGATLTITTQAAGGTPQVTSIPWVAGAKGFNAIEQSLRKSPMRPGERRTLQGLALGFNQVATIELSAEAWEPTALLDHTEDLLRITCDATLPDGNRIRSLYWANQAGDAIKVYLAALEQISYRTRREVAVADVQAAKFDLMAHSAVLTNRPLERPHTTRRVLYRVTLLSSDPAKVFASDARQRVTPLNERTAELSVVASDDARPDGTGSAAPPPAEEDRQPNNFIQSDAPAIVALAKQAAGSGGSTAEVARRLEAFVHETIVDKSFSQAFATAAEVAEHREGDCTEHSVLLAALARARGIPARVVVGLVYVPSSQGFGYHMWNELWIDNQWRPYDSTLGLGSIGAAHLKLSSSSLKGASAYGSFLPVAQVIGQLKIEILEAQ